MTTPARPVDVLRLHFGESVQEHVALAPYTSARIGGLADVFVVVKSASELMGVMQVIWEQAVPYTILGGGSTWFGTRAHVPNQAVARQKPKIWSSIELHQKL